MPVSREGGGSAGLRARAERDPGQERDEASLHGSVSTQFDWSVVIRQYCFSPMWATSRGESVDPRLSRPQSGTSTTAIAPVAEVADVHPRPVRSARGRRYREGERPHAGDQRGDLSEVVVIERPPTRPRAGDGHQRRVSTGRVARR